MAPRIDFYVLDGADDRALLVYACRLIEKAYLRNLTVCVHLETPAEVETFDLLLWTFGDRSFVPHERTSAAETTPHGAPVLVGCGRPAAADLLVNLASPAPEFYAGYARVADFVDAEPARREAGRRRFAFYRERGHTPETHRVHG
jgi:DNA polymerase-3 subunit chi